MERVFSSSLSAVLHLTSILAPMPASGAERPFVVSAAGVRFEPILLKTFLPQLQILGMWETVLQGADCAP